MLTLLQCAKLAQVSDSEFRKAATTRREVKAEIVNAKTPFWAVEIVDLVEWTRKKFNREIDIKEAYRLSKRNKEVHTPGVEFTKATAKAKKRGCDTCKFGRPMAESETGHFCEASAFMRCTPWVIGAAWKAKDA